MRAEGVVLHYESRVHWGTDEYQAIVDNEAECSSMLLEELEKHLQNHPYLTNYAFQLDKSARSTTATCEVHDAVSPYANRYTAEFEWLLQHLDFDLMDFEESERALFYQRTVDGVPTEFSLLFPAPLSHCHYHVWWSTHE